MSHRFLVFSLLFSVNILASPRPADIKVLVVEINPTLASQHKKKASEFLDWANPKAYVDEMIEDFRKSSHGLYNLEISEWIHVDEFPHFTSEITRKNGTKAHCLDEESFLEINKTWNWWDHPLSKQIPGFSFGLPDRPFRVFPKALRRSRQNVMGDRLFWMSL